ncbi:hypothetical protein WIW50_04925 [Flavobacteriaceae bacterium 3-367]
MKIPIPKLFAEPLIEDERLALHSWLDKVHKWVGQQKNLCVNEL